MSKAQRVAIRLMARENTGAIFAPAAKVNGGWVFPQMIRDSEAVALAVVNVYRRR